MSQRSSFSEWVQCGPIISQHWTTCTIFHSIACYTCPIFFVFSRTALCMSLEDIFMSMTSYKDLWGAESGRKMHWGRGASGIVPTGMAKCHPLYYFLKKKGIREQIVKALTPKSRNRIIGISLFFIFSFLHNRLYQFYLTFHISLPVHEGW